MQALQSRVSSRSLADLTDKLQSGIDNLVPGDILATNRLPTDEEREIIQKYGAPLIGRAQNLGAQISSVRLHIEEVKAQVAQMKAELEGLCTEEVAVTKACAPHRLALSPFRSLPEDVVREICIACMGDEKYPVATKASATPIKLTRISSVIRNVALTTPALWATVQFNYNFNAADAQKSLPLLQRCAGAANEWFSRAGGLPLSVTLNERTSVDGRYDSNVERGEFFDLLFSYSSRWRELRLKFTSSSREPLSRISALKATDVPLLQIFSLEYKVRTSTIRSGTILSIPTLQHVYLKIWAKDISRFSAGWEHFTSLQIHGRPVEERNAVTSIATILRKTTRLVYFGIQMGTVTEVCDISEILLPYLKGFSITEAVPLNTPGIHGLLKFINAPVLLDLQLSGSFLPSTLCHFFQRSPALRYLELRLNDCTFINLRDVLYYCPSLRSLVVQVSDEKVDVLLKAFVSNGCKGYLCPHLHTFKLNGETTASADCIREFLVGRRKGHGVAGLSNWAKVVLTAYKRSRSWQQTWAVVKEQQDSGLNVSLVEPNYYGSI